MKIVLILMFYVPTTTQITAVTTAEFEDMASCNAAYSTATKMAVGAGSRNSVVGECVAKGAPATGKKG